MNCKSCGKLLPKKLKAFCSTECKSEYQRNQPKIESNPTKQYRCKLDGKCFSVNAKRAGNLKKYSKNVLNKEYDDDDWELIDIVPENKPKWQCPYCPWNSIDIDNKSGWITSHLDKNHGLSPDQHCKNYPNDEKLWNEFWKKHDVKKIIEASEDNRIQCKICGQWLRGINNKHLSTHAYTVERYKIEFDTDKITSNTTSNRLRKSYYEHRPELNINVSNERPTSSRNTKIITCGICGKKCSSVGISNHLRSKHDMSTTDYVKIYGEFRQHDIEMNDRLETVGDKFKCLICDDNFISDNSLTYHVQSVHDITKIEYVKRCVFNNVEQSCKCGCGQEVNYLSYYPYKREYISGHNKNPMMDRIHTDESKEKMRQWHIEYGVAGKNKSNTNIELKFGELLETWGVRYLSQYQTEWGVIDFYLPDYDLLIEIDGESWHPVKAELLSKKLISSCISQKRKSVIDNLIRIRGNDVDKLNCVDDLIDYNFQYDFILKYRQVICSKDYLKKICVDRPKSYVKEMSHLLWKLIKEYHPEFPYPTCDKNIHDITDRIRSYNFESIRIGNRFSNRTSSVGVDYLKSRFKSYWHSSYKGNKPPVDVWSDDKIMRSILNYRIGLNNSGEVFDISLHQCIRGISAARYTVSFFKPMLAAAIYKHFLGDKKCPIVFDPCAGFGGRMLGFKSIYPEGTYIACEPNIDTYNELIELSNEFDNIILYNCKIEDINIDILPDIDLAFTSIPYYDLEQYSNVVHYDGVSDWIDTFLVKIKSLPNLLINVPESLRSEFGDAIEEYFIVSQTSHFDKSKNTKIEYLLKMFS